MKLSIKPLSNEKRKIRGHGLSPALAWLAAGPHSCDNMLLMPAQVIQARGLSWLWGPARRGRRMRCTGAGDQLAMLVLVIKCRGLRYLFPHQMAAGGALALGLCLGVHGRTVMGHRARAQVYCYEDSKLLKLFQAIVCMLYDADMLGVGTTYPLNPCLAGVLLRGQQAAEVIPGHHAHAVRRGHAGRGHHLPPEPLPRRCTATRTASC